MQHTALVQVLNQPVIDGLEASQKAASESHQRRTDLIGLFRGFRF